MVHRCHLDTYLVHRNRHKSHARRILDLGTAIYSYGHTLAMKRSVIERRAEYSIADRRKTSIPSRQRMARTQSDLVNAMAQIMADRLVEFVLKSI